MLSQLTQHHVSRKDALARQLMSVQRKIEATRADLEAAGSPPLGRLPASARAVRQSLHEHHSRPLHDAEGSSKFAAALLVRSVVFARRGELLARALARWSQGAEAAAVKARQRHEAMQSKWALGAMHTAQHRARELLLRRLVVGRWQHLGLARVWAQWLRTHHALVAQPGSTAHLQSKWALQSLHVERDLRELKEREWTMARLRAAVRNGAVPRLAAALRRWRATCDGMPRKVRRDRDIPSPTRTPPARARSAPQSPASQGRSAAARPVGRHQGRQIF